MTRSQSEIMRILDDLNKTCKTTGMSREDADGYMAYGLYSFGGIRPMEKAEQAVDEWRRLRKQKP